MAKKRKTKEQKEKAASRKLHQLENSNSSTNVYSIDRSILSTTKKEKISDKVESSSDKDQQYLRHDIFAISAASGIVIAFDILLFVMLSTGVIKLNFLGY